MLLTTTRYNKLHDCKVIAGFDVLASLLCGDRLGVPSREAAGTRTHGQIHDVGADAGILAWQGQYAKKGQESASSFSKHDTFSTVLSHLGLPTDFSETRG